MQTTHAAFVLSLLALAPAAIAQAPDTQPAPESKPERGLKRNEAGALQGFTLLSPLQSRSTYLVDMQGKVVHEWKTKDGPGQSEYLLENGHLLRTARVEGGTPFRGGGIGGKVQEFDWNGQLLWDYRIADEHRQQHHDIEPLPNGNVLMIVWEAKTKEEALAKGRDEKQVSEEGFWPDAVVEIEPVLPDGGKVVWEWHVWDHLVQDRDAKKANFGQVAEHPELLDVNADHRNDVPLTEEQKRKKAERDRQMKASGYVGGGGEDDDPPKDAPRADGAPPRDGRGGPGGRRGRGGPGGRADWMHVNSVDYDARNDLVVISSHNTNEIYVIDHGTTTAEAASHAGGKRGKGGDLLYRWGNPRAYGAGTVKDQQLFAQHDARFLADGVPGAGHLMIFDNGQGRPGGDYSRVVELELPFDAAKGFTREKAAAFGPKAPVWIYQDPEHFSSFFISGADRLSNGNTLICQGASGRVFEVTADKKIVWEYLSPLGGDLPMGGPGGGRGPRGGPGRDGPDGAPRDGGGPPGGDRGAPSDDGPQGGDRRGPPPDGGDGGDGPRDGPPGRGFGGPGGGLGGRGGPQPHSLFRATRIPFDHPAVKGRLAPSTPTVK